MFRKNVIRVQRWWRSFLACKLIRIRCLVRIWSLVEDSYKLEIENAVRKSERHKVRNSGSLDTLANFGSAYGASGEYGGDNQEESSGGRRSLMLKVQKLASDCVQQYESTRRIPTKFKRLRHSRSIDALGLKQLLMDLKPAPFCSSQNGLTYGNKVEINLQLAKQNIDIIRLLHKKTKGNLSTEENDLLIQVLADLTDKFVLAQKNSN